MSKQNLPHLYASLTPLSAESHGALGVPADRDFAFAREVSYAPLTMDEFPNAQRFYPIVFTRNAPTVPVALFGAGGTNAFVEPDGSWREGAYVPGYLRRYPFHLVRESAEGDRRVLCADLTSSMLVEDAEEDQRLFKDGGAGPLADRMLEFCKKYEIAMERARRALEEIEELDLIEESAVEVAVGGRKTRIDGFRVVAEAKLRALDDAQLAGLARRGTLAMIHAHLFSLSNFSQMAAA